MHKIDFSSKGRLLCFISNKDGNESVLKNIFKRGYKEIRDRKLLEILKRDWTWLKYELYSLPIIWYRGFYDTAVFMLSVPMHSYPEIEGTFLISIHHI